MDFCNQILKRRTLCGQAVVPIVHEEHIGVRSAFLRMAQKSVHLIVKVQVCLFVRRTVVICGDFVGLLFHVASYSGSRTNRLFILYQGSRSPSLGGFKIICKFFTPQVILNQAAHLCHGVLFRAVFDDGLDDIRYIPDLVLAYNRGRCFLHGCFHRNKSPFHGKRNNYKRENNKTDGCWRSSKGVSPPHGSRAALPIACDALNARTMAVRSYHYVFCASSPASCHTCVTARYLSLGISSRIYVMAYQPPSSAQKERTRFAYDAPPFSCGHICQGASDRNEERGKNTFLSGVGYLTRNVSSLVMSFVSSLRRSSSSTQRWGLPYSS